MNGKRNWYYLITITIVRAYFLGALAVSFVHIQSAFGDLGLTGFERFVSPLSIDGFAVLGMVFRSKHFAESTRTMGFRMQIVASGMSLVANVYAGTSAGGRIFGILVVAGYVVTEIAGERAKPAEADTAAVEQAARLAAEQAAAVAKADADRRAAAAQAEAARLAAAAKADADRRAAELAERQRQVEADAAARRSEAGAKAAATRAANRQAEADRKAAERERRRIARMERQMRNAFDSSDAPVSPAPGEAAAYL